MAGKALEAGFLEHLLEVGDAGENGRDLFEAVANLLGEEARDGGLARSRRTPEDQRAEASRTEHASQGAVRPQQMALPDYLIERTGP